MLTNSISGAMLEKSMSMVWQRMQSITHNISNEDTPGYKAQRLEFEDILRNAVGGGNTRVTAFNRQQTIERIRSAQPRVYSDESTLGRADGNNVSLENEQIELARVQIQYSALEQQIAKHNNLLKYVVSGGK